MTFPVYSSELVYFSNTTIRCTIIDHIIFEEPLKSRVHDQLSGEGCRINPTNSRINIVYINILIDCA